MCKYCEETPPKDLIYETWNKKNISQSLYAYVTPLYVNTDEIKYCLCIGYHTEEKEKLAVKTFLGNTVINYCPICGRRLI